MDSGLSQKRQTSRLEKVSWKIFSFCCFFWTNLRERERDFKSEMQDIPRNPIKKRIQKSERKRAKEYCFFNI